MIGRYDDEVSRWGIPPEPIELNDRARDFLIEKVGPPRDTAPVVRKQIEVPESRLDTDDLRSLAIVVGDGDIATGDDERLAHGGGFSYLDLLEHRGTSPRFRTLLCRLSPTQSCVNSWSSVNSAVLPSCHLAAVHLWSEGSGQRPAITERSLPSLSTIWLISLMSMT